MQTKCAATGSFAKIAPIIVLFAIVAVGAYLTGWVLLRVDWEMRGEILQQVRAASKAFDVRNVQRLTASPADLYMPQYQELKDKLVLLRRANRRCRFAYLMGLAADYSAETAPAMGRIVFLADSEPVDSGDYSPPGQAFDEDTADLRRVFATQSATVEGPVADRWGTWVSALAPLSDPATGKVVAVLGMDIDASDWRWGIAARSALPVGLILMLLIASATVFTTCRRARDSSGATHADTVSPSKPVLRQLLPKLAALFVALLSVMGALLWHQHRQHLVREIGADIDNVCSGLRTVLEQDAVGLKAILRSLAGEAGLKKDLRARDKDSLQPAWQPVFELLRRETKVTHFYFHDTNRVCLLRLHAPERSGDTIDRQTLLQAERTRKVASGLELGPLGTLTLRVVQPVFEEGALLGYVELGKEIKDELDSMNARPDIGLAIVLRKKYLVRQDWERGMRMLGREARWDLMAQGVAAYVSGAGLSEELVAASEKILREPNHDLSYQDVTSGGKKWRVGATSLRDASGKEIADLLALRDLAKETNDFWRLLTLSAMIGAVLLALLLCVSYVFLSHADERIRAQRDALCLNEERFAQLAEQSHTITWEVDAQGLYTYVSHVAEAVLGYRPDELVGKKRFYELHPEEEREGFRRDAFVFFEKVQVIHNLIHPVVRRDGTLVWMATHGLPVLRKDGTLQGYRGSDADVTERKRGDEALRRSAANLKAMALRLQAVREEERAALARELHDSLAQQLTAFALQIELLAMDAQPLARRLPECAALYDRIVAMVPQVEQLTAQTQRICAALRPSMLESLGLVAAVEWLVEDTARASGLDYKVSLPGCDMAFERTLTLALFRVVQEALNNVVRHAQATRVCVRMFDTAGGWEIEIEDNGVGFEPDAFPGETALGLLGMRERMSAVGGTVDFLSGKGDGTTVRVRVPNGTRREERKGIG